MLLPGEDADLKNPLFERLRKVVGPCIEATPNNSEMLAHAFFPSSSRPLACLPQS